MKERIFAAALIAAVLCYAVFACRSCGDYPKDYKDVYEQIRMEQIIQ